MAFYEFMLWGRDTPEKGRVNIGDILAVRPHPFDWGSVAITEGVIVIIESDKTLAELRSRYSSPLYDNGKTRDEMNSEAAIARNAGQPYKFPASIAKRMFRIPMVKIKKLFGELDTAKVKDETKIYQPFKSLTPLISAYDGKGKNDLVEEKDADTGQLKETDLFIMKKDAQIIYNKATETYEAP